MPQMTRYVDTGQPFTEIKQFGLLVERVVKTNADR